LYSLGLKLYRGAPTSIGDKRFGKLSQEEQQQYFGFLGKERQRLLLPMAEQFFQKYGPHWWKTITLQERESWRKRISKIDALAARRATHLLNQKLGTSREQLPRRTSPLEKGLPYHLRPDAKPEKYPSGIKPQGKHTPEEAARASKQRMREQQRRFREKTGHVRGAPTESVAQAKKRMEAKAQAYRKRMKAPKPRPIDLLTGGRR